MIVLYFSESGFLKLRKNKFEGTLKSTSENFVINAFGVMQEAVILGYQQIATDRIKTHPLQSNVPVSVAEIFESHCRVFQTFKTYSGLIIWTSRTLRILK